MEPISNPEAAAERFLDILQKCRCAAALTGAGVSTASGIPDFRGPSGLYSKISQRTFEIDFLMSCPAEYYKIAVEHIHTLEEKEPNATHILLARLEEMGLLGTVITQNIDGLHRKAGSEKVIEFHGNVTGFHCTECEKAFGRSEVEEMIRTDKVPRCIHCKALIRPDIVFFGDLIPFEALMQARKTACEADVFITLGSSLEVNPAAGLAADAWRNNARLVIINRGPTRLDVAAAERFEVDLTEFSTAALARI